MRSLRTTSPQLTLWDIGLDEWTDEMRAEAIEIFHAAIVRFGGTL
jgi:hypothetical protein